VLQAYRAIWFRGRLQTLPGTGDRGWLVHPHRTAKERLSMDNILWLRKLHDPGTVTTGTEAEPSVCLLLKSIPETGKQKQQKDAIPAPS